MDIRGTTISGVNIYDTSYLYAFTTFTFATGNTIGQYGPNAAWLFGNSYSNIGNTWLQNSSYFNIAGNGYQFWTVPATGTYSINIAGARAGINGYTANTSAASYYGNGAVISAQFALTQGQILTMVVGQPSTNATGASFAGPGGGGGTFVAINGYPLIVAGGGGATGAYVGTGDGSPVKYGQNGTTNTAGTSSNFGAQGGTNGQGGNSHVNASGVISSHLYDSGGGGGFYSNGVVGSGANVRTGIAGSATSAAGGNAFVFGSNGGAWASSYSTNDSWGGFGGGGGGGPITGGGGGGYSGGGGSYATDGNGSDGGGGGGSWIAANVVNTISTSDGNYNGSNSFSGIGISNLNTFNSAAGYVTITRVS